MRVSNVPSKAANCDFPGLYDEKIFYGTSPGKEVELNYNVLTMLTRASSTQSSPPPPIASSTHPTNNREDKKQNNTM